MAQRYTVPSAERSRFESGGVGALGRKLHLRSCNERYLIRLHSSLFASETPARVSKRQQVGGVIPAAPLQKKLSGRLNWSISTW